MDLNNQNLEQNINCNDISLQNSLVDIQIPNKYTEDSLDFIDSQELNLLPSKPMERDSILRRNVKSLSKDFNKRPNSMIASATYSTPSYYDIKNNLNGYSLNGSDEYESYLNINNNNKGCCIECGSYTFLIKCISHCDKQLCESCQQQHWQNEINDLLKLKTFLENNVNDLKRYLGNLYF